ncbi:MAG: M23 family metallopeptidase [Bacilli bacterium]|nr:M23 family metallopeptidase [Bacilli bacterium]
MGDGTDIYEDLRKEIGSTISDYQGRADIDGVLILATLIGYNDNEGIEDSGTAVKNIANMKRQVDKLASYQIMVTKDCSDDSSTIRKIASNDSLFNEENRNCVAGVDEESYSLSIEEGEFDNDNSGSVYYWNLIDEEFIFDYYNEYMVNRIHNTSENHEKIEEIISEIYSYYQSLLLEGAGADYFAAYITNTGYWWPIGSRETTLENGKIFARGIPGSTNITAWFGGNDAVHKGSHGAIDIGGVRNVDNVIATKSGTVIYPYNKSQTRYGEGYLGCTDGGGYGNYVMIDHGDGTYSLYAHMHKDTITVFAGDVVEQGQVIGKLGHSGNSTGPHLHFEIRSGGSTRDYKVDPLLYVDPNNPRPSGGNDFFTWIMNIECSDCDFNPNRSDGDDYIVYKTNTGSLDVAYGIQLVNPDGTRNIDYPEIYNGPVEEGIRIPKDTVKKLFNRIYAADTEILVRAKATHNVVLTKNQEVAILSLAYNTGGDEISPAIKAYAEGGSEGYWNYIKTFYSSANADNECGLKIRRAEEYELFTTGDYKYDPISWTCSKIKYYDTNSW